MYYLDLATRKAKELVPNGRTQTFWGDNMLVSRIDFDPHVAVPEHKHPHEQFGVVLSGEVTMLIAGEPLVLRAGEMYIIPGNVPHSAKAGPEGFVAAEVFSPVREDLKYE
jgi:quercetin dioxygenase-like cupin family protein